MRHPSRASRSTPGGWRMRNHQVRAIAETNDRQEENRLMELIAEMATLLEGVCSSQVKTCKRVLDARDIPREVRDVLSDRVRSHEKDLQRVRKFLAKFEIGKNLG